MIAMDFTSDTADIRAVALATSYTSYVADPAQVLLPDGTPLDPEFMGYVVERVRDRDGAQIAELHDPKTGALVLGPAGKPVQVVYRPKGSQGRAFAPGRIYSQHMHDLILDPRLDWGGRRILVGGLGASARFEPIDQDLLHKAAETDLAP